MPTEGLGLLGGDAMYTFIELLPENHFTTLPAWQRFGRGQERSGAGRMGVGEDRRGGSCCAVGGLCWSATHRHHAATRAQHRSPMIPMESAPRLMGACGAPCGRSKLYTYHHFSYLLPAGQTGQRPGRASCKQRFARRWAEHVRRSRMKPPLRRQLPTHGAPYCPGLQDQLMPKHQSGVLMIVRETNQSTIRVAEWAEWKLATTLNVVRRHSSERL